MVMNKDRLFNAYIGLRFDGMTPEERVHPEFLTKFENRNITLTGKCDIT